MLIERGIVKIGLEIEVAAWKRGVTYQTVAKELMAADLMVNDGRDWVEAHTYRCECAPGGCNRVRSGDPIYDPIVSLTYDASLPMTGAEFVTSTIVLADEGLTPLKGIWDIISEKAIWRSDLDNRRADGKASPSIHIHASASQVENIIDRGVDKRDYNMDVMHVLSLYAPEMIALASVAENRRGLAYRQPIRYPSHRGHHGFIHVRDAIPEQFVYIEWRMFEAQYDNWKYVESAAFLSAVLTRALLSIDNFNMLMANGYDNPFSDIAIAKAVTSDSVRLVLEQVSKKRLDVLRRFCMAEINDDEYGGRLVDSLFDKVVALA